MVLDAAFFRIFVVFFFQAEDGIRDIGVTGVQTCALPILLEPVGAVPVIIEDDVLVGGGSGVYEGTIVRERAVLAPGTILTGSTVVHDVVREQVYRRPAGGRGVLEIPAGAVVVPGSRAAQGKFARERGLSLYTPIIIKYRDDKTDAATLLEEALR